MLYRLSASALCVLFLAACATAPDDGKDKEKPDAEYCETDAGDRIGTEVCRQY